MKFTAQQIRFDLQDHHPQVLEHFYVGAKDRVYQIWERYALSIDLYSRKVLEQKLDYIHRNRLGIKWNLANTPEEYYWSSAMFYEKGIDKLGVLEHYKDFY